MARGDYVRGIKPSEVNWQYPADYTITPEVVEIIFVVPVHEIDSRGVVRIHELGRFVKLKEWKDR